MGRPREQRNPSDPIPKVLGVEGGKFDGYPAKARVRRQERRCVQGERDEDFALLAAPFSKIDEPGPSSCDFYQRSGDMAVVQGIVEVTFECKGHLLSGRRFNAREELGFIRALEKN